MNVSEIQLAEALFKALKESDPKAMVSGEPIGGDVIIIDGTFNLVTVAKLILYDLRDRASVSFSTSRKAK